MIFKNNIYLITFVFSISILIQYYRYRSIAKRNFNISGLLLIKILIRTLILILLLVVSKSYFQTTNNQASSLPEAVFVIETAQIANFELTDDDAINILSRIPEAKFSQLELLVYSHVDKKYFVFIPATSVQTFIHLLKIDRSGKSILIQKNISYDKDLVPVNHIELFQSQNSHFRISDPNQENFNLIRFLDQENSLISPYLLQYLLILILFLMGIDLGIKYRILKV